MLHGGSAAAGAAASGGAGMAASLVDEAWPWDPMEDLPDMKAVPRWAQRALLLKKLRCCVVQFTESDCADDRARGYATHKRQTLLELVDFCAGNSHIFHDYRVLEETFGMLRANILRSLPALPDMAVDPDEEEEPYMDPAWPRLGVAYEFLLHLVSQSDIDPAARKKAVDPSLVRQLLTLFNSADARERDYLKTITHRVYSKLTQRRALIRRVIAHQFYEFVYESRQHHGIAELLEILASIINGFAVPIKDEHKDMLKHALVPLHKPASIVAYHPQLSYCMALFVAKDHELSRDIIPALLRMWPVSHSPKAIMFLNELEDIFEYVQLADLQVFVVPLAKKLEQCVGGAQFQIAERALCLWHTPKFSSLMLENEEVRHAVLPVLFSALAKNAEGHWHEAVRTLSTHVLDQYSEIDPVLYDRCYGQRNA